MLYKYGKRTRKFLKGLYFSFPFNFLYFGGVLNETISPLACWIGDNDIQRGPLTSCFERGLVRYLLINLSTTSLSNHQTQSIPRNNPA